MSFQPWHKCQPDKTCIACPDVYKCVNNTCTQCSSDQDTHPDPDCRPGPCASDSCTQPVTTYYACGDDVGICHISPDETPYTDIDTCQKNCQYWLCQEDKTCRVTDTQTSYKDKTKCESDCATPQPEPPVITSFKCGSDGNCREISGTGGYPTEADCVAKCSPSFSVNDSFWPWWMYIIIALAVLVVVIVVTVVIVRRRKMSKQRQPRKK